MKQQEAGRLYLGYEDDIVQEKLAIGRYEFALNYIKEGEVCLDAVCGSGYGSIILSRKASKVIGIELDDHALEFALSHYPSDKVSFQKADLTKLLYLRDDYFDVIVSIETIEHIPTHDIMIREFNRVLKPNGLLVLSTVDHEVYSIKGGINNKHHINELTKKQLVSLLSKRFKVEEIYGQIKYVPLSLSKRIGKKLWLTFLVILSKIDVFKVRYRLVKSFHLNGAIHIVSEGISPQKLSDIERIGLDDKSEYYQLIIIARKVKHNG